MHIRLWLALVFTDCAHTMWVMNVVDHTYMYNNICHTALWVAQSITGIYPGEQNSKYTCIEDEWDGKEEGEGEKKSDAWMIEQKGRMTNQENVEETVVWATEKNITQVIEHDIRLLSQILYVYSCIQ